MTMTEYIVFVDGAPLLVIRSTPAHKEAVARRSACAYGVLPEYMKAITVKPRSQCTDAEYALAMVE